MTAQTPENSGAEKQTAEIEKTVEAIEKQEAVLENAEGTPQEKAEQEKYNALLARFDSLTGRLDSIESKLNEPTVPAPVAKETSAPVVDKEVVVAVEGDASATDGKPKKRRLGAWG